jgi:phosphate transport system substrate-binding protein
VVKNASGAYVEASLESTSKAADGFSMPDLGKLSGEQSKLSITNSTNPAAWPISTFTFLLVAKDFSDKGRALAILRYAWWGTHEGQAFTKDLGYAPLPAGVVTTAEQVLKSVTSGGSAVLK